jgi:hypothetical protein
MRPGAATAGGRLSAASGHSDDDDLTLRSIEGIAFYALRLLKGAN